MREADGESEEEKRRVTNDAWSRDLVTAVTDSPARHVGPFSVFSAVLFLYSGSITLQRRNGVPLNGA